MGSHEQEMRNCEMQNTGRAKWRLEAHERKGGKFIPFFLSSFFFASF